MDGVAKRVVLITVVALASGILVREDVRRLLQNSAAYVVARSPHERYAAVLRLRGVANTPAGRVWLAAADSVIRSPRDVRAPFTTTGIFDPQGSTALAWRLRGRRGHRVIVEVEFAGQPLFLDLFGEGERLASAPRDTPRLDYILREDTTLVLRVQPELGRGGSYHVVERSVASITFPVEGLTPRAVQSRFGDSRDAGRRAHEGIDIFARAATRVLAAIDGWIGPSTTNQLGGNVVWLWSPSRRLRLYYAHLQSQAVSPGARVRAGEVIGYVGSTGNARGGPPHLHFGVYLPGIGSVDPLPYVCDAPCGRE
jgi:murein DD-endopeptidase MepM/ murein hydrolase activator NlpD